MKKMKRIMALLLAAMLVLGMSITAFADEDTEDKSETGKIFIEAPISNDNVVTHTYKVYQIFVGDLSEDKKTLSNIKAGVNFDSSKEVTSALVAMSSLTEDSSYEEKLAAISPYVKWDSDVFGTVDSGQKIVVPAGYYLIMDDMTKLNGADGADGAATLFILKVTNDVKFTLKSGKPTVDKQVLQHGDNGEDVWAETADHQINEKFKFRLLATVPSEKLVGYDKYYLQFNDELSEGVTYDGELEVNIYIESSTDTLIPINKPLSKNLYTVVNAPKADDYGGTLTIAVEDIKAPSREYWGQEDNIIVEVIYSAHLNDRAKVAKSSNSNGDKNSDVNYNDVDLEYSNNPNWDGTGDRPTGRTPKDTVWVFTYEVDNKKVIGSSTVSGSDDQHLALEGAGFTLYETPVTTDEGEIVDGEDPIKMILVTVEPAEGSGESKVYYYRPAKEVEEGVFEEGAVEEMTSQEDGTFNIRGLEDGTYYLIETKTPSGFNTCDAIVITISSEHSEYEDGATVKLELDKSENMNNTIANFRGSLLPHTGGIGTTIFYVVGGILVVGCGVVLVTRKFLKK